MGFFLLVSDMVKKKCPIAVFIAVLYPIRLSRLLLALQIVHRLVFQHGLGDRVPDIDWRFCSL